MTKKQESVTLSISPEQKIELEKLALELGYLRGKKPNVSGLIKAIASGELLLTMPEAFERQHRALAKKAIGSIKNAIALLDLI